MILAGAWCLPVQADIDFGVRGGAAALEEEDDAEALAGVEIVTQLGNSRWYFNPNSEIVFGEIGERVSVNGDVHYDFITNDDLTVWAGGGPALLLADIDEDDVPGTVRDERDEIDESDVGVNVLGGVGFNPEGAMRPYVQGKVVLAEERSGSVAVGLRF